MNHSVSPLTDRSWAEVRDASADRDGWRWSFDALCATIHIESMTQRPKGGLVWTTILHIRQL